MRQDLPTPIRHELDMQRREFARAVGRGYEELLELGIDPTPWMASVMRMLEAEKSSSHIGCRAA